MLFLYFNEFDAIFDCSQYFNDSLFYTLDLYYVRYDHVLKADTLRTFHYKNVMLIMSHGLRGSRDNVSQ